MILVIRTLAVQMRNAIMASALACQNIKAIHTGVVGPNVSLIRIVPAIRPVLGTNALIHAPERVDKMRFVKYSTTSQCVVVLPA